MEKDTILEVIESVAADLEYIVYERNLLFQGENSHIVVKLDKLDGISHQDCDKYSKLLSEVLDEKQLLTNYTLEVSSPGVNRKIRSIQEFDRFKEAPVKIVYHSEKGVDVFKGTISDVIDSTIVLQGESGEKKIPFSSIVNANLDY